MNRIHPTAIIDDDAILGNNNVIGAYCVIEGAVVLGDNNIIGPHVCIGQDPQFKGRDVGNSAVVIGNNNVIREFVTIHGGTVGLPTSRQTVIGNDCFIMAGSHINHDCVIEDGVVISNGVLLAGHVRVMTCTNLGMGTKVHQHVVVPPYSMFGMGSVVTKKSKLYPFSKHIGVPAQSMRRYGFDNDPGKAKAGIPTYCRPDDPRAAEIIAKVMKRIENPDLPIS